MKNKGKVFSISQIYEEIWNEEAIGADNTVAVHIRHIREGWTLEGAYNSLEEAVSKLGYLENQMQLLENYRKEESNLRYLYVDLDEKEVYTNEEDIRYSDYEKALKEIKKAGCLPDPGV